MSSTQILHSACAVSSLVLALATSPSSQVCGSDVLLHELDALTTGPVLRTPDGAPVVGGRFSLRVEGAQPNEMGALIFSPVEASFFDPAYAATLFFGTPFDFLLFVTDADGCSEPLVVVPDVPASLCGEFAIFQAGVFDVTATGGVAISNAIRLRVGGPTPVFPAQDEIGVERPFDIAFADFDEDGLRDMGTLENYSGALGIGQGFALRRGLPGGGFDDPSVFLSLGGGATEAGSIRAADIDGNGRLDVVATNDAAGELVILLGGPGASFISMATYGSAGIPRATAPADFDGDGDLDVAVALAGNNYVTVHPNLGVALFGFRTYHQAFPAPPGCSDVAAVDLDEDGHIDLLATTFGDALAFLPGNGDMTFGAATQYAAGDESWSMAVADLDGDTLLDVAVANYQGGDVSVFTGAGGGVLNAATTFPAGRGPRRIRAADFDGDLLLDLVTVNELGTDVSILRNLGAGAFETRSFSGPFRPHSGEALDADLDGDVDVVVTSWEYPGTPRGTIATLHGRGDGTLDSAETYVGAGLHPRDIEIADLDQDGENDLILLDYWSYSSGDVGVRLGIGEGRFGPLVEYPTGERSEEIELGDLDGNGYDDMVVANLASNFLTVLLNQGDGTFVSAPNVPVDSSSDVELADLNADGKLDLVSKIGTYQASGLGVALGNGDGTFGTVTSYLVAGVLSGELRVELVDQDAVPDLILGSTASSDLNANVHVWLGVGDGTFGAPLAHSIERYTGLVGAADLNGDGLLDLITREEVLLGNGDGTFTTVFVLVPAAYSLDLGDVNGDQIPDLVQGGLPVRVRLGLGDGTFGAPTFTDLENGAGRFEDMDGDGVLDVVLVNDADYGEDEVKVRLALGNGDGTFQPPSFHYGGTHIRTFAVDDVDGDGIPDVVVADESGFRPGNVAVLLNRLGE